MLEDMRERRGLRLEDLAASIGVATSTIQRWEKRSISIPSERLPAIADAYGCRIADIFDEGEGGPLPSPRSPKETTLIRFLAAAKRGAPAVRAKGEAVETVALALSVGLQRLASKPSIEDDPVALDEVVDAVADAARQTPPSPSQAASRN